MDKYQEFFPNDKFPADIRTYQFPEMYYICGATDKGDDYLSKEVNNYCDKVRYYGNMKPMFRKYYEDEIDEGMSLLKHFSDVAKKYERTELAQELADQMTQFLSMYYVE